MTEAKGKASLAGKPSQLTSEPHHRKATGKAANPGRASPSGASHPTAKAKRTA